MTCHCSSDDTSDVVTPIHCSSVFCIFLAIVKDNTSSLYAGGLALSRPDTKVFTPRQYMSDHLKLVPDSPARPAVPNSRILDPAPLNIVVADLGIVCIRLLPACEHPPAAQVIHAQHAFDVRDSLHLTAC